MGNWLGLEKYMDGLYDRGISSGACLIYQDGKEKFRHYSGYKNIEMGTELSKTTLYRIYSLTKLYTSVAALMLVDQKKMKLSDLVSDYLPEFKELYYNRVEPNGWNTVKQVTVPLTVFHLLTMTSGISYAYDNAGPTMQETRRRRAEFHRQHEDYSVREYAGLYAGVPLAFEPGSHFLYGAGYDVLAAVLEAVTGERFGNYLKKNIWEPLELESTMFHVADRQELERLCGLYRFDEEEKCFIQITDRDKFYQPAGLFEEGGGGLLSSLDDYMKFLRMLQNGGSFGNRQFLKPETFELLVKNALDEQQTGELSMPGYGYGMGVRVRIKKDGTIPAGEFGWHGMSGSYSLVDRNNRLCVVYMQQMVPGREREIHPDLLINLYRGLQ